MDVVRDAVLVAAGLGKRMFPASAFSPKEALPLIDVPLLTHLILEAKEANIQRFHVVVSPTKSFEPWLENRENLHALQTRLDKQLFHAAAGMEIHVHVQREPKGVANAIEAALGAVEGPFLVMLGDNLLMDVHAPVEAYVPSAASKRLVQAFMDHGKPTIGLMEVDEADVGKYGIVGLEDQRICAMVEKPAPENAPSKMAICGRYVFSAETQALLKTYTYDQHGELQSIALLKHWMNEGALHGHVFENTQWYDSGDPLLWLKAQVDHALRRADYGEDMRAWLNDRLSGQR